MSERFRGAEVRLRSLRWDRWWTHWPRLPAVEGPFGGGGGVERGAVVPGSGERLRRERLAAFRLEGVGFGLPGGEQDGAGLGVDPRGGAEQSRCMGVVAARCEDRSASLEAVKSGARFLDLQAEPKALAVVRQGVGWGGR